MNFSTGPGPQGRLHLYDDDLLAVVRNDVELVVLSVPRALAPGRGIIDLDSTLAKQADQIPFHQALHQLAPLAFEQILQGLHFLVRFLEFAVRSLEQVPDLLEIQCGCHDENDAVSLQGFSSSSRFRY